MSENARKGRINDLHLHTISSFNNLVLDSQFKVLIALDATR